MDQKGNLDCCSSPHHLEEWRERHQGRLPLVLLAVRWSISYGKLCRHPYVIQNDAVSVLGSWSCCCIVLSIAASVTSVEVLDAPLARSGFGCVDCSGGTACLAEV